MIAGIFSKPHPFEDGAFLLRASRFNPQLAASEPRGLSWWRKVNRGGWTTLLWIKPLFGDSGELWGVQRFGSGLSRLSSGIRGTSSGAAGEKSRVQSGEMMVQTW